MTEKKKDEVAENIKAQIEKTALNILESYPGYEVVVMARKAPNRKK